MSLDHAIYAEYSLSDKEMQSKANIRVFNKKEKETGGSISLDTTSGIITLQEGVYQITAFGCVTYSDLTKDVDGKVTTRTRPNGSYCLLYYASDIDLSTQQPNEGATPIAIGSIANANMVPSTISTYVHIKGGNNSIVLVQQAGTMPTEEPYIYLQVSLEGSKVESHDHVFARITICKKS